MLFKNVIAYRLTQSLEVDQEALEKALASKAFRPCESQDLSTIGFTPPVTPKEGDNPDVEPALSLWAENCVLVRLLSESKVLPNGAITQKVQDRVNAIEKDQLRKVYRKEKDQLRDEIIMEYLPKALSKRSSTFAAIDLTDGLIYVDAMNHKQAEALLSTLREALGSLPVRPVSTKVSPSATLTDWVKTQDPTHDFNIGSDCEIRSQGDEASIVRFKNTDLSSEEVLAHLKLGHLIVKLNLAYSDKLSFVLQDNLQIKSMRLDDLLIDQASKNGGDDSVSQYTATFVMSVLTLRAMIPQLLEALGGESIPESIGIVPDAAEAPAAIDLAAAAEKFVIETQRASISALQRKLKIGYNEAARQMEGLEAKGVVSSIDDKGARSVLVSAA
ncbi:recombination-associated protein RdgC [Pseudomonas aeruginosa]|nr:recombination-associated protein RdgC [Pseudomonas aeruginosa]MBD1300855.1 recombination-associated protein RdgC [Pseudomonas aeruginosa]MBD1341620.1 recombination-associated protein RdgC [Pseudomonas aeruginosa]RRS17162.1 recombination-associated protein RdgC [Pseudomonas aeruginosa]RRS19415.1 recombination-associated protein RdgC [Pseudomonas aeruginosa]